MSGSYTGEGGTPDLSDFDGILSFLLYSFVLHPICGYILHPARKWKKPTAIYLVTGFLGCIALSKLYMESQNRGPNFYQVLEVTRVSSNMDIRRSYKRLVLELHPDKNHSPGAAEQFAAVKSAYDTLVDMEKREIYNKLGEAALRSKRMLGSTELFVEMGIYYIISALLTYFLTLGNKNENARIWALFVLIAMFALEITTTGVSERHGGLDLPPWVLPNMTQREIVQMFHTLYPLFMNGCRLVSSAIFVDLEKQTRAMIVQLLGTQNLICIQLKHIEHKIGELKSNNSSGRGEENSFSTPRLDTIATRLVEIGAEKNITKNGVNNAAAALEMVTPAEKGHFSIPFPSFWILIFLYSVFYYFTRGSITLLL